MATVNAAAVNAAFKGSAAQRTGCRPFCMIPTVALLRHALSDATCLLLLGISQLFIFIKLVARQVLFFLFAA